MSRQVALVTGASRGIGRATAVRLARAGYDVAFTARTVEEGSGRVPPREGGNEDLAVPGSLATTRSLVEECGVRALPVPMDLLDLASVRAAADAVHEQWGPVDLLVNNAIGQLAGHGRVLELDLEVVLQTLTANFVAQLALVQGVLPRMLENGGGTVVDMASGSATTDPPAPPGEGGWSLAYSASKAAFGRLAGCLNAEHRGQGVRAFNVDPGFVVTESMAARGGSDLIADKGFTGASPEAAGAVIAWLASSPEADAWLGRTIWSPKLAAELGLL